MCSSLQFRIHMAHTTGGTLTRAPCATRCMAAIASNNNRTVPQNAQVLFSNSTIKVDTFCHLRLLCMCTTGNARTKGGRESCWWVTGKPFDPSLRELTWANNSRSQGQETQDAMLQETAKGGMGRRVSVQLSWDPFCAVGVVAAWSTAMYVLCFRQESNRHGRYLTKYSSYRDETCLSLSNSTSGGGGEGTQRGHPKEGSKDGQETGATSSGRSPPPGYDPATDRVEVTDEF